MKFVTPAMAEALTDRGFSRHRRRWRLLRPTLPVEVYEEKARHGPHYGMGVLFGAPGIRKSVEENVCLQVSQRGVARRSFDFFYNLSRPDEAAECERDFFAVMVPLIDQFKEPVSLVRGVIDGRIAGITGWDAAGRALGALDVVQAHGLWALRPEIEAAARRASLEWTGYERLARVAEHWPDRNPALVEIMATVPAPPTQPVADRAGKWWAARLRAYRAWRYPF